MIHAKDIIEQLVEATRVKLGTDPRPYYFHGTPIMVANKLNKIRDGVNKSPLIYLFETTKSNVEIGPTSNKERDIKCRLFFGKYANPNNWTIDEFYTDVLDEIRVMVDTFMTCVKESTLIIHSELDNYEEETHSNWGLYVKDKGHMKNIFNEKLSGIEVIITLPIRRQPAACQS